MLWWRYDCSVVMLWWQSDGGVMLSTKCLGLIELKVIFEKMMGVILKRCNMVS